MHDLAEFISNMKLEQELRGAWCPACRGLIVNVSLPNQKSHGKKYKVIQVWKEGQGHLAAPPCDSVMSI